MPIKCAIIGYGYWGRNVAKAIVQCPHFELITIYDEECNALDEARKFYQFTTYSSYEAILFDKNIQRIFITTPPHTHFALAKRSLESAKHTFVEKPLTTNLSQAKLLYDLADSQGVKLYCDHIFLHSPAINYLKEHIASFGEIVYINARRINLGLFQSNVDVIWDLAIHDLSIIDYLVGLHIEEVSTFATKYLRYPNDALANINIKLKNGIIITLNLSWLSPIKVREMIIGGSKKTAIYDETKHNKITLFNTGVVIKDEFDKTSLYQKMVEYKLSKELNPILPNTMALDNSIAYFATYIAQKDTKTTSKGGKEHVIRVIQAIEMIQEARIAPPH